ncbi:hypothetical protein ABXV18_27050 [Vibrio owensii]|uniref:hypothetical protein n=1 Tax=Vibrio owensii TaxID=696485 RepID=UPI00339B218E
MCEKQKKIEELERQLEIEANINKLRAERELMFWQGKSAKRKFEWFIPMTLGAGILATLQVIVSILQKISI